MFTRAATFVVGLLTVLGSAAPAQQPKAVPAAPKSLLVFYGWPSTINGANGNVVAAASHFALYDIAVIGGGLEDPKHQDYGRTKQIIQGTPKTKFYGYVPLGNRPGKDKCLTDKEIADRIQQVSKLGAKGVLLDEFGFDYGVTRARQNEAVKKAHALKIAVIANAWDPDHAFLPDANGAAPSLREGDDAWLWESYRFMNGETVGLKEWRDRAEKVAAGRKALPLLVYSLSTNTAIAKGDEALFAHQWFSAAIDGHDATGWGYPGYAASDSKAPRLNSPDKGKGSVSLGNRKDVPVQVKNNVVSKATSKGVVEVDAVTLTGKFTP